MLHRRTHGTGPTRVVLVHGFTQTGRSWAPVVDRLAADRTIVCVDLPGHGRSADHPAGLWDGARLLGQAGGAATYLGYSMGGRLALHLALDAPQLVRGLVLVGATPGIEDAPDRAARRDADDALARSLEAEGLDAFLERWLAQDLFASLDPVAADLDARRENTVAGLAASLRMAGAGQQEPLWDRLCTLSMPVLVVAGERDGKFSSIGRRMTAAIGPNARFVAVPGAGHAAHLEQPDAFCAVVAPFLDRHHLTVTPRASSPA